MKNIYKAIIIAVATIAALASGFVIGAKYVLDNQIVTDQAHAEGNYEVMLDGKTYMYWYE